MIKHAIDYLIRDSLVSCFLNSLVLNDRLNRVCHELDSLGLEQNFLRTTNVWNFINEKTYWLPLDATISSRNEREIRPINNNSDLDVEVGSYVTEISTLHKRNYEKTPVCNFSSNEESNFTKSSYYPNEIEHRSVFDSATSRIIENNPNVVDNFTVNSTQNRNILRKCCDTLCDNVEVNREYDKSGKSCISLYDNVNINRGNKHDDVEVNQENKNESQKLCATLDDNVKVNRRNNHKLRTSYDCDNIKIDRENENNSRKLGDTLCDNVETNRENKQELKKSQVTLCKNFKVNSEGNKLRKSYDYDVIEINQGNQNNSQKLNDTLYNNSEANQKNECLEKLCVTVSDNFKINSDSKHKLWNSYNSNNVEVNRENNSNVRNWCDTPCDNVEINQSNKDKSGKSCVTLNDNVEISRECKFEPKSCYNSIDVNQQDKKKSRESHVTLCSNIKINSKNKHKIEKSRIILYDNVPINRQSKDKLRLVSCENVKVRDRSNHELQSLCICDNDKVHPRSKYKGRKSCITLSYDTKYRTINRQHLKLKIIIYKMYSLKSSKVTRLLIPRKPNCLIVQIFVFVPSCLRRICLLVTRRKSVNRIHNTCSWLNNVRRKLDGRIIRELRICCEIRSSHINVRLNSKDRKRVKVFIDRVPICQNLYTHRIFKANSKNPKSENCKLRSDCLEESNVRPEMCGENVTHNIEKPEVQSNTFYSPCSEHSFTKNKNVSPSGSTKESQQVEFIYLPYLRTNSSIENKNNSLKEIAKEGQECEFIFLPQLRTNSFIKAENVSLKKSERGDEEIKFIFSPDLKINSVTATGCCSLKKSAKEGQRMKFIFLPYIRTHNSIENENVPTKRDVKEGHETEFIFSPHLKTNSFVETESVPPKGSAKEEKEIGFIFLSHTKRYNFLDRESGAPKPCTEKQKEIERIFSQHLKEKSFTEDENNTEKKNVGENGEIKSTFLSHTKEDKSEDRFTVCLIKKDEINSEGIDESFNDKKETVEDTTVNSVINLSKNWEENVRDDQRDDELNVKHLTEKVTETYDSKHACNLEESPDKNETEYKHSGLFEAMEVNRQQNHDSKPSCTFSSNNMLDEEKKSEKNLNDDRLAPQDSHERQKIHKTICVCPLNEHASMTKETHDVISCSTSTSTDTEIERDSLCSCYNNEPGDVKFQTEENVVPGSTRSREIPQSNFTEVISCEAFQVALNENIRNQNFLSVPVQTSKAEVPSKAVSIDDIRDEFILKISIEDDSSHSSYIATDSKHDQTYKNSINRTILCNTSNEDLSLRKCSNKDIILSPIILSDSESNVRVSPFRWNKCNRLENRGTIFGESFESRNDERSVTSRISCSRGWMPCELIKSKLKMDRDTPRNSTRFTARLSSNTFKDLRRNVEHESESRRDKSDRRPMFLQFKNQHLNNRMLSRDSRKSVCGKSIDRIKHLIRRKFRKMLLEMKDKETNTSNILLKSKPKSFTSCSTATRDSVKSIESYDTFMSTYKNSSNKRSNFTDNPVGFRTHNDVDVTKRICLNNTSNLMHRHRQANFRTFELNTKNTTCTNKENTKKRRGRKIKKSYLYNGDCNDCNRRFERNQTLSLKPSEKAFLLKSNTCYESAKDINLYDDNTMFGKKLYQKGDKCIDSSCIFFKRNNKDPLNKQACLKYRVKKYRDSSSSYSSLTNIKTETTQIRDTFPRHSRSTLKPSNILIRDSIDLSLKEKLVERDNFGNSTKACERCVNDFAAEFRLKLSQYVALCKSVKYSLIKRLRSNNICEASVTSIS